MRATTTATRALVTLAAYAVLILARLAHAASPAPSVEPAPSTPVIAPDCGGPCSDPEHDHHQHAHDDHCPLCQSVRFGADALAPTTGRFGGAIALNLIEPEPAQRSPATDVRPRAPARAPPAR